MKTIRYTLRGEGTSDRMLQPIIDWVLDRHLPDVELFGQYADTAIMPAKSGKTLASSIADVLDCYPCEVLFIHRDADHPQNVDARHEEVIEAFPPNLRSTTHPIPVVPIRMSEAWMLIEEQAIRNASGNPNGSKLLDLPPLHKIEGVAQPKELLCDLLTTACELNGRRLKTFHALSRIPLVAKHIRNFTPLRKLTAFRRFEADVQNFAKDFSEGS